jgi:hypothetical protein
VGIPRQCARATARAAALASICRRSALIFTVVVGVALSFGLPGLCCPIAAKKIASIAFGLCVGRLVLPEPCPLPTFYRQRYNSDIQKNAGRMGRRFSVGEKLPNLIRLGVSAPIGAITH